MASGGRNFLNSLKPFFEVKFIIIISWFSIVARVLGGTLILEGTSRVLPLLSPPLPLFPLATLLLLEF